MTDVCEDITWFTGVKKYRKLTITDPTIFTPPPPNSNGTCNMTAVAYTDSECHTPSTSDTDISFASWVGGMNNNGCIATSPTTSI